MKINKTETAKTDWRQVLDQNIQLAVVPIPTGEVAETVDGDGVKHKQYVTEAREAFGFQTEQGRGMGVQWVPVEDVQDVVSCLREYAENGVENVAVRGWLNPVESIRETITREKAEDGTWNISFRVRLAKGSKSLTVPEAEFGEFVERLSAYAEVVPEHIASLRAEEAAKAEAAAKRAAKKS